jgi:hypothetical protein
MKKSGYEPIRSWDEVFKCIDQIVADPCGNTELIKALNINLRVETGSLPGYRGSGFAEKADSIVKGDGVKSLLDIVGWRRGFMRFLLKIN